MSDMTGKELRVKIDSLVAEMGVIQTQVNGLAAQLMVVTKEEMETRSISTLVGIKHTCPD